MKVSAAVLFTLVACASLAPAALADSGLLPGATTPVTTAVTPVTDTASEVAQAVVPAPAATPPAVTQSPVVAETATAAAEVGTAGTAIAPILETTASTERPAVDTVSKAAAPAVKAVADTAAPVLKPVARTVVPVVRPVTRATAPVLRAVAPVLDAAAPVLDAAVPVLDAASPVVGAAAPVVGGTTTIFGNGGGRGVAGLGRLLPAAGSIERATAGGRNGTARAVIEAVTTPAPSGVPAAPGSLIPVPGEGASGNAVLPSARPSPLSVPGSLPPRALELPPAPLVVHDLPAAPADPGTFAGPRATSALRAEADARNSRAPWPREPVGPLGVLSSAAASAGTGAFPILLAAIAAALFLAAPRLGRRLRPTLAPWPLPIPQVSPERPG